MQIHQFQKSFNKIIIDAQILFIFFEEGYQNHALFNPAGRSKIVLIRRRQRDEKVLKSFNAYK